MPESLPTTDPRRAAQLRAELDRVGSATTPGWPGPYCGIASVHRCT